MSENIRLRRISGAIMASDEHTVLVIPDSAASFLRARCGSNRNWMVELGLCSEPTSVATTGGDRSPVVLAVYLYERDAVTALHALAEKIAMMRPQP